MIPLKCDGIGRDAENDRSILVCFSRPLTGDELRDFHDLCREAAQTLSLKADEPESVGARFAREVREGTARFVTPDGRPTGPSRSSADED